MAPGTNNGAESCIKNVRFDAGNVIGGVGETLAFVLEQVKTVSNCDFDAEAVRKTEDALWRRAAAFRSLFGTDKVRSVANGGLEYCCCSPRAEPDDDNVCNRGSISTQHATNMVQLFAAQRQGAQTSAEELVKFCGGSGARAFGLQDGRAFCSCPAFCPHRRCFHTLGLELHLGMAQLPKRLDDTPLSLAMRGGNKPKAPGRGAVPLMADEKDSRIAQLEAQLRKMKGQTQSKAVSAKRASVQKVTVAPPAEPMWQPLRRLRSKQARPPQSAPSEVAETQEQAEARQEFNAIALVQNEIFIEGDAAVGKSACEPPMGQPRLQQELLVAANGRCLTHCCVAASSPEEWSKVPRHANGTPTSLADLVKEDEQAKHFLLTKVQNTGMPEERLAQLLQGEYGDSTDLSFFAAAIGGTIGAEPPDGDENVQGVRYYGQGPLTAKFKLYYLSGKSQPHYKLVQSWILRLPLGLPQSWS